MPRSHRGKCGIRRATTATAAVNTAAGKTTSTPMPLLRSQSVRAVSGGNNSRDERSAALTTSKERAEDDRGRRNAGANNELSRCCCS